VDNKVLLSCKGLSKKFCKDLKSSLWYGTKDSFAEIVSGRQDSRLRKNEFWAINNVDFKIERGECLGLLGRNGAGKTTLLKLLSGLIKPDLGEVRIFGKVGGLIALGAGFSGILTGRENIFINGAILGHNKDEIERRMDEIVDFAELGEFIDTPVQNYSSGMSVRLGFAIAAILSKPDILLLDEVLAVGDIAFTVKCLNVIRGMMQNAAVVFVSHNMQYVAQFCTSVLVMEKGSVIGHYTDVSTGIDFYLRRQRIERRPYASSLVSIAHEKFNSHVYKDDELLPVHVPGRKIQLNFELTFISDFDPVELKLYIADQYYNPIIVLKQKDKLVVSSTCKIGLEIDKLLLSRGKYSFILGIVNSKTGESLGRYEEFMPFECIDSNYEWCSVMLNVNKMDCSHESNT
jgi:lipopolysaccharide transport system ATP-binding protein